MMFPERPTRANIVPMIEARIDIPPIASGYSSTCAAGNVVLASSITATAVTA